MRRHALLLVVALLLLAGACNSDDQPAMEGPFPQITTTTSTTVQATPPSSTPGVKLTSPAAAANHLYEAWKAGDRAKALQAANERAVTELFGHPFNTASFRGCDEPDQLGADCSYRYEGGGLILHVIGDATTGFIVETAQFLAD